MFGVTSSVVIKKTHKHNWKTQSKANVQYKIMSEYIMAIQNMEYYVALKMTNYKYIRKWMDFHKVFLSKMKIRHR